MTFYENTRTVKLRIPAKKASPTPPVGPILGQEGINIIEFCKKFNDQTKQYKDNIEVPTVLKVRANKTYDLILKSPSISHILTKIKYPLDLKYQKFQKSSKDLITLKQIYEIALFLKKNDDSHKPLKIRSVIQSIIGTSKSMGLNISKK